MSDDNCPDLFDKLAEERFTSQADVEYSSIRTTRTTESSDDEDILESIEEDILTKEIQQRHEKIKELQLESSRWEKVLHHAQQNNIDVKRIAKVSRKISQILFEIQDNESWIEKYSKGHKQRKEIERIEKEIEQLENEHTAIETKLDILVERLRVLKPYNARNDFQNDPKGVVDDEESFESLAKLIDKRRKDAIAANEYNGDPKITSRGVIIKNPKSRV
jgi:hypothetical protein